MSIELKTTETNKGKFYFKFMNDVNVFIRISRDEYNNLIKASYRQDSFYTKINRVLDGFKTEQFKTIYIR